MKSQSRCSWAFQIAESIDDELAEFHSRIQSFRDGRSSAAEFRAFRVPMGVYEQRESGTYMLRVRLPAGAVTPPQMHDLAQVSEAYGDGLLHVTTRQDIQVHGVSVQQIHPALVALRSSDLSTQGGGGNTVRNVTSCPDAGICRQELFDVRPYAIALTERLMSDPLSQQLPRKYKIALSGCDRDCSAAQVNDLGFIAREQSGKPGFAVYVGGGMGNKSRVGDELHDFIPASDAILVAEAIKRVFDRHGDRRNKHAARLRFLIGRLGFPEFRALYEQELAELRASRTAGLQVRAIPTLVPVDRLSRGPNRDSNDTAYLDWVRSNVLPQKQEGFYCVILPLALGNIEAKSLDALADIVSNYGEGILHTTQAQNLVLRWLQQSELAAVYAGLTELGLASPVPQVLRDLVACAGASTCRLGLCQSRGLAEAITSRLQRSSGDLLRQAGDVRVNISGCPNACGRHPIGDIGLSGAARRIDDRLVPSYYVHLGGGVDRAGARLGEVIGAVPAKVVPDYLVDLLGAWSESGAMQPFAEYVRGEGKRCAAELVERYRRARPVDFTVDWASQWEFSLAGRGSAECGAGVFDLIELDLDNAKESAETKRLYRATLLAARALLVTKGHHPSNDVKALELFQEHFLDEGLVACDFGELLASAIRTARTPDPDASFEAEWGQVTALVSAVTNLYKTMDASLRFKPSTISARANV